MDTYQRYEFDRQGYLVNRNLLATAPTVTRPTDLRHAFERDGFVIHPHSLLSPEVLAQARQGLFAVRDGHNDTGVSLVDAPFMPLAKPDGE